jgi:acyl-CoA synthetase (AMP-forming)/AMP-acid ligase II
MTERAPSYSHGASPIPLDGSTLGRAFDAVAARFPDNECVVSVQQGRRLTYTEMARETDRLARALAAIGVEHGERVGIWSPNSAEWLITQLGTPKIGAILVNINPGVPLERTRIRVAPKRRQRAHHARPLQIQRVSCDGARAALIAARLARDGRHRRRCSAAAW